MGLLTRRTSPPPSLPGSAPAPPNPSAAQLDDPAWLQLRQDIKGLDTGISEIARFLQRIEQRMSNFSFDEQTIRVPAKGSRPYPLPEGTAGIVVSAPSGFALTDITITCGIHVYTPNANSNPVFIPTTRTLREVIFANSSSSLVAVNVTALGHAAAQAWAASNGTGVVSGVVSLTGRNGSLYTPALDTNQDPSATSALSVVMDITDGGAGGSGPYGAAIDAAVALGTGTTNFLLAAAEAGMVGSATATVKRYSNGVAHFLVQTNILTGATATIWTPAANKRFRLLAATLALQSGFVGYLQDGGTDFCPAFQGAPVVLPDNGYLSLAANNVLTIANESGSTLFASVMAIGVEE